MEIQKLILSSALVAATLLAQSNWPGIEPGLSTRADIDRVAGPPVQTVTPTLVEYKAAQPGHRAFVQFRPTGVVARVEILLQSPQDRATLLRTLGLGEPEVTRQNSRGQTEELFGSKLILLTLGAGAVERVAYYSRDLFEAAGGRVSATPAAAPPPTPLGSRLPPPIGATPSTTPTNSPAPIAPPPTRALPTSITIPATTKLRIYLGEKISTAKNKLGDRFTGTLADPLIITDEAVGLKEETVAPKGARVEGRIAGLTKSGRVKGVGELNLELTAIQVYGGEIVPISTGSFLQTGETSLGSDAKKAGIGTGVGAAIGAIAGGGKGAAVGAGAGAAAAAGAILITRGKPAEVSVETVLNFQLTLPVTVKRPLAQ